MYDLGLEAFLAVARTQNMSRAATKLNLAQSTISKRIQVLEQQIGTTLLERRHGVTLTPAGEKFVDLAEQWDYLKHQIESFHIDAPRLSLSIGTVNSLISSFLPELYCRLNQQHPTIKLKVIQSHSAELYDEIERRQVDVAFSLLKTTNHAVVVEECFTEPLVVIRKSEGCLYESKTIHPHGLNPDQELYASWGAVYQDWHDQWWDPYCWGRNTIATTLLIPALLRNQEKWAIVPLTFAQNGITSGQLCMFYLSEAPPNRIVYKLTHKAPKANTLQCLNSFNEILDRVLQEYLTDQTNISKLLASNPI